MLRIQIVLLKIVGLLPLSGRKVSKKVFFFNLILLLIALCFLLGTLYSSGFSAAFFLYGLFYPSLTDLGTTKTDPILAVLQLLPFFTINVRALSVLFVLFLKRRSWKGLMDETQDFLQACFPCCRLRAVIVAKMKKASMVLFVATFTLHVLWEYAEWVVFLEGIPNVTMSETDNIAAPLPMKYYLFEYIILWTLFSTIPFILSQQVYVCAIILAMVLGEAVKRLDLQIQEELKYYKERNGSSVGVSDKELELTEGKVKIWEFYRMQILVLLGSVNNFFSLILFAIYGMDFLTLLGFTSNLIKNPRSDVDSYTYLIGSSVIFVLYGTIFLIPFVKVHEEVSFGGC
jgi:hypothetical protein